MLDAKLGPVQNEANPPEPALQELRVWILILVGFVFCVIVLEPGAIYVQFTIVHFSSGRVEIDIWSF